MDEKEIKAATRSANAILDQPYADPDSNLAMLARQFLRALERQSELLTALRFWFPDKEDSRARSFPGEWERDFKLLERLK